MAEIFQTTHSVRITELGSKNDLSPKAVHQPALARDTEFRGECSMDMCNDLECHGFLGVFHGKAPFCSFVKNGPKSLFSVLHIDAVQKSGRQ